MPRATDIEAPAEAANRFESLSPRTSYAIAFFLPVVLLLPFVGKALHADDLLFVWVAEQIAEAPFDFYGFSIDYGYAQTPIHEVFHNPPAVSYYLALAGSIFGASEIPYHLAMTLVAGLAGLGTYFLARDLVPRPLIATCIAVLTPAFMVSASTLMADIPLTAAFVWAVYFWRRGMREDSRAHLLAGALVVALGILCKYYALVLLPLLLVYGLAIKRRPGRWCAYLAIPVIALAGLQVITYALYGSATLSDATGIALAEKWRSEETFLTRPILTLVFLGGCLGPFILFLRIRASWKLHAATGAIAVGVGAPIIGGYSGLQLMLGTTDPLSWSAHISFALMAWLGATLLALAARACLQWKNADALLLALWLFGTVAFSAGINHYVNARTLLPMLPAIAILIAWGLPKTGGLEWRLIPACAFTLWTLFGDYEAAGHGKHAAENAIARATESGAALHHIAFWGSEYYLLAAGSTAFAFDPQENYTDAPTHRMAAGDLLFIHSLGADTWQPPPEGFEIVEVTALPYRARLATFYTAANAGFYSHRTGYLPFAIGNIPPEPYLLLKWTGPQEN